MSNTRRFKPERKQQVGTLRQEIAGYKAMLKFQSDRIADLEAQLAATKLERPADIEEWINEVALGEMDDDERAEWDAMSDYERERFVDALGQRLAATERLVD